MPVPDTSNGCSAPDTSKMRVLDNLSTDTGLQVTVGAPSVGASSATIEITADTTGILSGEYTLELDQQAINCGGYVNAHQETTAKVLFIKVSTTN